MDAIIKYESNTCLRGGELRGHKGQNVFIVKYNWSVSTVRFMIAILFYLLELVFQMTYDG